MGNKNMQYSADLWTSPVVRVARLGGLCVVAASGLVAAGAVLSQWHTTEALLAGIALAALPAMSLGGLACHRLSGSPKRPVH